MSFDLQLTAEQVQLTESFGSLYAAESTSADVRANEISGFDPQLWSALTDVGVVAMAVAEAAGGWGAALLDLALVAEQQGIHLASAPVIETQVAARLLSRCEGETARRHLDAALAGNVLAISPHPVVGGQARMVPGGAVATGIVALVGDRLVVTEGCPVHPIEGAGVSAAADVPIASSSTIAVIATGDRAVELYDGAIDEWLTLVAAALVGIGGRALEIGVDYAKQRHAFGRPIGAFQAIAHRLADGATAVDGARLLAYEAAWAGGEAPDRAPELGAMACAFAAETARQVTHTSLHVHGGYGYTVEYDIQLYFRRAWAWAAVFGEPRNLYRRAYQKRRAAFARVAP